MKHKTILWFDVLECNIKHMSFDMWFLILVWFRDTLTHVFNMIHANTGNKVGYKCLEKDWRALKSFVMVCALCAPGSSCVFFWTWYTCGSEATELNVAVESLESLCLCRRQRGCTTHHLAKYPYDRLNFHYVLLMFEFKSSNHIEAYHISYFHIFPRYHDVSMGTRIRSAVKQSQWHQDPLGIQCNCCCGGPSRVQSGAISPSEAVVWLWFTYWSHHIDIIQCNNVN